MSVSAINKAAKQVARHEQFYWEDKKMLGCRHCGQHDKYQAKRARRRLSKALLAERLEELAA